MNIFNYLYFRYMIEFMRCEITGIKTSDKTTVFGDNKSIFIVIVRELEEGIN